MKKGDVIVKKKVVEKGKSLWHNLSSLEAAEAYFEKMPEHYNFPEGGMFEAGYDDLNPGKFAVLTGADMILEIEAKVNWIVDYEVGILYLDTGANAVIDIKKDLEWTVKFEAEPEYQSGVEHMTDEQLRASIDNLRHTRVNSPKPARVTRVKEAPLSESDRKKQQALKALSPEQKMELMRKLGMVD